MSRSEQEHDPGAPTGVASIAQHLNSRGVAFEVLEHEPTMSAAEEARKTHTAPTQVAKTVVLHDGSGYVLAVVPASERLDVHALRDALGADRQLRLASEDEIARDFPAVEVGAVPPFVPSELKAEVIDRRLLEDRQIVCAGGDHRHSVVVDPRDVVRITNAMTADICEQ